MVGRIIHDSWNSSFPVDKAISGARSSLVLPYLRFSFGELVCVVPPSGFFLCSSAGHDAFAFGDLSECLLAFFFASVPTLL